VTSEETKQLTILLCKAFLEMKANEFELTATPEGGETFVFTINVHRPEALEK
jgi:hypothetical protein